MPGPTALYLDPEQLHVEPVSFSQQLPLLTWTYDLTPYGRQRFETGAHCTAEDRLTGTLRAAITLAAAFILLTTILAFLTGHQHAFFAHFHQLLALCLTAVAFVYLRAWFGFRIKDPYPLTYHLRLAPAVQPANPETPLILTLECTSAPPPEHAPVGILGALDPLAPFEIRRPQQSDLHQRQMLLAHFTPDEITPRRSAIIATWTPGELEAIQPASPLQQLHEQLSWVFFTTRNDWRARYHDSHLAPDTP